MYIRQCRSPNSSHHHQLPPPPPHCPSLVSIHLFSTQQSLLLRPKGWKVRSHTGRRLELAEGPASGQICRRQDSRVNLHLVTWASHINSGCPTTGRVWLQGTLKGQERDSCRHTSPHLPEAPGEANTTQQTRRKKQALLYDLPKPSNLNPKINNGLFQYTSV